MKRLRRKIDQLREEPEHVRFRAATYITGIGGVIIVILWVTVLLPLQLYFQRGGTNKDSAPAVAEQEPQQNNQLGGSDQLPGQTRTPQVGGAFDATPNPSILPLASVLPIASVSQTPDMLQSETQPVEVAPN